MRQSEEYFSRCLKQMLRHGRFYHERCDYSGDWQAVKDQSGYYFYSRRSLTDIHYDGVTFTATYHTTIFVPDEEKRQRLDELMEYASAKGWTDLVRELETDNDEEGNLYYIRDSFEKPKQVTESVKIVNPKFYKAREMSQKINSMGLRIPFEISKEYSK